MDKLSILKKKRALKKGNLTRTRRRAFVLIDSRGSKRELNCILKDLDEALNDVLEVNLEYVSILEDEEELKSATEYEQQVTEECNEAQERIKEHLKSRSDEAPSAVSRSQASAKSRGSHRSVTSEASAKAKQAEIDAKVLQLETDQLASRQSQERENEDVKRQLLLQEKKDATAAAKLRAELSKAAENDLTWERRNDFVEETAKEPKQDVITKKSVPANTQVSALSRPASAEPTESIFMRSLPRLQLTKFSGSSGEWPRWIALFRALVGDQPSLTKTEKMAHLQSAVTGPAQQTIAGMMFNGDLYDTALKALEDRFGREQDVVHATLSAVFACPAPRYMDAEALDRFQSTVHSAVSVMESMGYSGDLQSQENLRRMAEKLPPELRRNWGEHILDLEPARPSLLDFDSWLSRQVRIALNFNSVSEPRAGNQRPPVQQARSHPRGGPSRGNIPTVPQSTRTISTTLVRNSCLCCGSQHELKHCQAFKSKSLDERAQFAADGRCCFNCLKVGHISRECRGARRCGIDGCPLKHSQLLHGSQRIRRWHTTVQPALPAGSEGAAPTGDITVASTSNRASSASQVLLQVVPVRVHGTGGKHKDTLALLDPGSQTSLCKESVLHELSIQGETQSLRLCNVEDDGAMKFTQRVKLELSPLVETEDSSQVILVPEAFAVKRVNIRTPTVNYQSMAGFEHLEGLKLPDCTVGEVELLLGANVLEAIVQREARVGKRGEPAAIRTAFGWSLTGSMSDFLPSHTREVMFVMTSLEQEAQQMTDNLQDWWSTEAFGTKLNDQMILPPEDAKALEILEATTRYCGDHYEVGLLWKDENSSMPDNYNAALQRLKSLEKSLSKNPDKAASYKETIDSYVEQGYARQLSQDEAQAVEKKRWILPHHAVTHPEKPKPRVVFDAAAEVEGVSLNSQLLKGPDLLTNLCGVLLRFREEKYALVGDIYQMFHQIRVRSEDQVALSYMWRDLDTARPPCMYQMMVVIFGAKCSPTIANYVLRRTLCGKGVPENDESEKGTLHANFYVDDFLRSEASVEDAEATRKEVSALMTLGGFRLTKWRSNCRDVLADVPEAERNDTQKTLLASKCEPNKALGCVWSPDTDTLGIKVKDVDVPTTKRGIVKRAAMLFDPLGFIVPFVLLIKIVIQTLWAQKLGWDAEIGGTELATWNDWLKELPAVEDISVPRCLKMSVTTAVQRCELHLFADASESAFAAVAYVRFTDAHDQHHISLIMSKSRLAPLKTISIVRLELQAAVLATRLANTVHRELNYKFDDTVFWSDSQVVLQFITNESRMFNTFVANRVSEIRDSTHPSQWRHVPGRQNPADIGSRGMSASQLKESELWWHGPAFLKEDPTHWPYLLIPGLSSEAPELKRPVEAPAIGFVGTPPPRLVDPSRFSSWSRYRRVYAWVRRFIVNLRARRQKKGRVDGPLTVDELIAMETFIIVEDQARQKFDSPQGLSLFKDEQGVVRVKGRLASAPLAEESQTPIVLCPESRVTRLIISELHANVLHSGVGHTLNQFRQKYWAPRARALVKKILNTCMYCRNRRSQPSPPRMADLPKERFDMSRPFMSVGLDYLGPLYVKKFRKTEKRYVLLVTCLATRAIHLEVAHSLDMDSFLLAFRRFVARRGSPMVVYSDNGTNLVAGEKELRLSLEEWNQNQVSDALAQDGIQWKFNPPYASHMGGVWERLVASVKRALYVVLGNQIVSDDVLHTTLTEVEYALNSRPLTYVSGTADDPEAITPNHFLLKSGSASALPPGVFGEEEVMSRKRWRQTQALANQVWRRWMREYIPTLIARRRWNADTRNVTVGDVVLLVSDDEPRGHWPLGIVEDVYPSKDGIVRSALVRTSSGSYKRPCTKICVLEKRDPKTLGNQ